MPKRIIVIGGGFGGVRCARTLRKELHKSDFQIVVFNTENHMVFHPLLAEVVGASVQPKDVG
ncbi:MAG: FAD-dependent oxidoreductase, partial [Cyanobacteria bacterium]|nr:FAD-dependent oxidoreductase [Cyanobacteriota bacterium]